MNLIKKTITYLRNKVYNYIDFIKLKGNINKKLLNPYVFNVKTVGYTVLEFKKGFKIKCSENDKHAVAETCINEDYTNDKDVEIKKGDVVFDIGSHIGSFAVNAANSGAKVYSFEPNKKNFNRILENININNFNNIEANNYGLYKKDDLLKLYIKENTSGHSFIDSACSKKYEKIEVRDINEIIEEKKIKRIDLVKIDVEGAEYEILPHISKENYKKIEKIIGEYHLIPGVYKNYKTIKKILEKNNFKVKHKIPYYFIATKKYNNNSN